MFKTILLAEDNEENKKITKLVLEKEGYKVDTADNGKIAVEKSSKNIYSLIIMDIDMPEMNGFEAIKIIREKLPVPIIVITAGPVIEYKEKALTFGIDNFITKPFKKKQFLEAVKKVTDEKSTFHTIHVDPDLMDLIPEFIENRKKDTENIEKYLLENNIYEIRRLGHGMKGYGSMYGFKEISIIGEKIEYFSKKADKEEIRRLNKKLKQFIYNVKVEKGHNYGENHTDCR